MHQSTNSMAAAATLHCLTGCAIGEIAGLIIGNAAGWSNLSTVAVSIFLAFIFGYSLSLAPLFGHIPLRKALLLVLAADTLSITVMELTDNAAMVAIPGAMDAGLVDPLFWMSMSLAMLVAFVAAFPVNRWLLQRGQGHALMHQAHHH